MRSRVLTLLAVTAHPDDESFLFGGTLALHAEAGGRCGLLCLTDGQAGRRGELDPAADLGRVRRQELEEAVGVLGIPHLYTPGLSDGKLDDVGDERGAAIIAAVASDLRADVLLTFGPEGASGHADHRACWRWTRAAAGGRRVYAATFPEDAEAPPGGPPLPVTTVVDISPLGDRKRLAFLRHRSQRDHLALFDRLLAQLGGREYYHRVQPPWRDGDGLEHGIGGG